MQQVLVAGALCTMAVSRVEGGNDIVVGNELYIVNNRPVKLVINSRDVIHDVGLPHFRMKMDAVPGTPTTMWFTPKFTSEEMKKITGKPDFEYELACDQVCGRGHYTMRAIVKVVSSEDFILWRAKQQSNYTQVFPVKNPAATPKTDTVKATAAVVLQGSGAKMIAQKH